MAEHHHHHGHGHDFAEANKEHFNKDSHTYDDIPMVKEVTEKYAPLFDILKYSF